MQGVWDEREFGGYYARREIGCRRIFRGLVEVTGNCGMQATSYSAQGRAADDTLREHRSAGVQVVEDGLQGVVEGIIGCSD